MKNFIAILFALSLLTNCGSETTTATTPDISSIFTFSSSSDDIVIDEDYLDTEFLLLSNMVEQYTAPMFHGLKSRVVKFVHQGDSLFMVESSTGNNVSSVIPTSLILAEFPIIETSGGKIRFDFASGISKIFDGAWYYASDIDGIDYQPNYGTSQITLNYIDSINTNDRNELVISMFVQTEDVSLSSSTLDYANPSYQLHFNLSPYALNENFTPTVSPETSDIRFFECDPLLELGGETTVHALKYDVNKMPITFYISSNTPAEYKEAISSGILYWNKVYGGEFFVVADATEDMNAAGIDYNMIQWIDWDTANYAYANAYVEPRTCEVLSGQFFFPSAFATGYKYLAWEAIKRSEADENYALPTAMLRNFEATPLCDLNLTQDVADFSRRLIAAEVSDETLLTAVNDYIRSVAAHEVGHIVGLRHNFAGSVDSDYNGYTQQEVFEYYIENNALPDGVTFTNSIMDYSTNLDRMFIGRAIHDATAGFPHDTKAINYLYKGETTDTTYTFCTDQDNNEYLDCRTFDLNSSPIRYAADGFQSMLSSHDMPFYVYEKFVLSKNPEPGEMAIPVSKTYLNISDAVDNIMEYRALLFTAFTSDGLYVSTLGTEFPGGDSNNILSSDLREATLPDVIADIEDYLANNSYSVASISDMLEPITPAMAETWTTTFNSMMDNPAFYESVDPLGVSFSFTETEREQAKAKAATFFNDLIPALVEEDISILDNGTVDVANTTIGAGFLEALSNVMQTYLMATNEGETITATVDAVELSLPVFTYDWEVRLDATSLLNYSLSDSLWWGSAETDAVQATFLTMLNTAVDGTFTTMEDDFAASTSAAYEWFLENNAILTDFGSTSH